MIQIRRLIHTLDAMHEESVASNWDNISEANYRLIKAILENFWIEGEPGHEEHHVHPKAFGDEEDVRI